MSASASVRSSRIGSTCGECEATSTATSRAITSRSSHAATSSRTVWVAPPITVDCGEATTATTASVTPRAISSESTCCAGSSTDAMAPAPAMRVISLGAAADHPDAVFQRQRSGDDGCRGLTQGVADDRAGGDAVGLHRGGQGDLHGEQGGLHAVDAGDLLGCGQRFGHREAGLRGDQRLDLGDRGGEYRLVGQQVLAHRGPLRTLPGEHPDRAPVVLAHRGRDRELTVGDLTQRLAQLRGVAGQHGGAHRSVPAPAGQRVGQIRMSPVPSCASTQSASRPAVSRSAVLRAGRQRENQRAVAARPAVAAPLGEAGAGACSKMACTLVPEMPYDDTAARRGWPRVLSATA